MRPVERGRTPTDAKGRPKRFKAYADARADLIARLGEFCSYCEMHLDADLAVEHVQPKAHHPNLALSWDNFLLACRICNSTKGQEDVGPGHCYWPDADNTSRALDYLEGGRVVVSRFLQDDAERQARAQRTIALTGLDKRPWDDPQARDRRWNNRREAWDQATRALQRLGPNDTSAFREQIVDTAINKGFWSVWMTVFRGDHDMQRRLLHRFQGTALDCFGSDRQRVRRAGSDL
ncbi:HNH endonuclease [Planctomycetota bacterium]|nr:HNH endonuclease [Planctomycetota bacterium]